MLLPTTPHYSPLLPTPPHLLPSNPISTFVHPIVPDSQTHSSLSFALKTQVTPRSTRSSVSGARDKFPVVTSSGAYQRAPHSQRRSQSGAESHTLLDRMSCWIIYSTVCDSTVYVFQQCMWSNNVCNPAT